MLGMAFQGMGRTDVQLHLVVEYRLIAGAGKIVNARQRSDGYLATILLGIVGSILGGLVSWGIHFSLLTNLARRSACVGERRAHPLRTPDLGFRRMVSF